MKFGLPQMNAVRLSRSGKYFTTKARRHEECKCRRLNHGEDGENTERVEEKTWPQIAQMAADKMPQLSC
jgi:hypothetical protein